MNSKCLPHYDVSRNTEEQTSRNGMKSMLRLINQIKQCDETDESYGKKKDTIIRVAADTKKSRDLSATVRRVAYGFKLARNLNELGIFTDKIQNNSMNIVKSIIFKTILDYINKYFAKYPDVIPRATEESKQKLTSYLKDLLRMKTKPEVNSTHPSFKSMDALNLEILCIIKILAEKACVSENRKSIKEEYSSKKLQMALDNLEHTQVFLIKTYRYSRDSSVHSSVQTALSLIRAKMEQLRQLKKGDHQKSPISPPLTPRSVEGGNNEKPKSKKKPMDENAAKDNQETDQDMAVKTQKAAFIKIQKEINQLSLMKFQVRILNESLLEEVEELKNELDHQKKINKALKDLEKVGDDGFNKQPETKQLICDVQDVNDTNKKLEAEVTLLESLLSSLTNNQDISIRKINNIKSRMTTFLKERREYRKLVSQKKIWLESLVGADITQIVCLLRKIFKSLLSGNPDKQPLQEFVDILNRSFCPSESAS